MKMLFCSEGRDAVLITAPGCENFIEEFKNSKLFDGVDVYELIESNFEEQKGFMLILDDKKKLAKIVPFSEALFDVPDDPNGWCQVFSGYGEDIVSAEADMMDILNLKYT